MGNVVWVTLMGNVVEVTLMGDIDGLVHVLAFERTLEYSRSRLLNSCLTMFLAFDCTVCVRSGKRG